MTPPSGWPHLPQRPSCSRSPSRAWPSLKTWVPRTPPPRMAPVGWSLAGVGPPFQGGDVWVPVVGCVVLVDVGHVKPPTHVVVAVEGRFVLCMILAPAGGRQRSLGGGDGVLHFLLCVFFDEVLERPLRRYDRCHLLRLLGYLPGLPPLRHGGSLVGFRFQTRRREQPFLAVQRSKTICAGRGGASAPGGKSLSWGMPSRPAEHAVF